MKSLLDRIRQVRQGNVLRQGSIVLFDQGFLSITNFATGIFIARACSKEEYGLYILIWSLLLILVSIHRAIVYVPLTVYLPRLAENEQSSYQGSALVHTLLLSLIFSFLLYIAVHTISTNTEGFESTTSLGILVAILATPFLMREFVRNAQFAQLHFTSSLKANFAATVLQLSIVIILYYTNNLSLLSALLAVLAGSILATVLLLSTYLKNVKIHLNLIIPDIKRGWDMSKWMLLNVVGGFGSSQIFPWLIMLLIDAKAVAVFGASLAVSGGLMSPLLRAANAYILPKMSHGFKQGDISQLNRILVISTLALLIPYGIWTILGSIFAEQLLTLFYSEKYAGYGTIVILLLIKYMIESVSTPLTSALQTLEKPIITTKSLAIGTLITCAGTPFAVTHLNLSGAALISVLSAFSVSLYKYIKIKQIIKIKQASSLN